MIPITTGTGLVIRISDTNTRRESLESITDTDGTVVEVGSTGVPAIEPLVMVTKGGQTAFHVQCSSERVEEIVSNAAETDDGTTGGPDAIVDHDPDTTRLPTPQLPGLGVGVRHVLGACGWRRPANPADFEAAGGFDEPDSTTVLHTGRNLRGRGWGDLCHDGYLTETWETVRDLSGDVVVVVNAPLAVRSGHS